MEDNIEVESAQIKAKKAKKRLITVILIIVAVFAVLLIATAVLKIVEKNLKEDNGYTGRHYTIIYYEPIENIFEDKDYLGLNRNVYYTDSKTGEKYIVNESTMSQFQDTGVPLLYDMIQAVINGDAEAYDAMFGEYYYSLDKDRAPKEHFYMQELYNINIAENGELSGKKIEEDGKTYTQYVYTVTFMIHKNNGTFMLIDSDAEKPQVYYITDMSGELKIDNIQTVTYKY